MSNYIVSARKYRPATFKTVVGQQNITSTLKNAIDSKRLAQAYLFCGPRGVGKTSCARIFAKTINCLNPTPDGEACGKCESCRSIDLGNSFNIIELDAASSNSVDDIRRINDEVNIPPQVGEYRVFIIDEVHMLTSQAFNAFLKTLEEPPKYTVFILATTEKHKVIPTILSRCQIYDFKRITTGDIVDHLSYVAKEENIEANAEALNVIARKADGAMRDALSIFDQIAASTMGHITYESALANLNVLDYDYYFSLVDAFRMGDVISTLLIYNQIQERGFDPLFFINGLASHIRDLMVAADPRSAKLLEVAVEVRGKYTQQAQSLPLDWYYSAIRIINDTDFNYRTATNKQLLVELMLIRLCQLLNPPVPPFDRKDGEIPPLKKPEITVTPVVTVVKKEEKANKAAEKKDKQQKPEAEKPETPKTEKPESPKTEKSEKIEKTPGKGEEPKAAKKRGVRLTDIGSEYDSEREKRPVKRVAFTDEDFMQAWSDFIEENPEKQILTSAMKTLKPGRISPEEYQVKVVHPAQEQAFKSNMTHLLNFLRDRLSNDFVAINIELSDTDDIVKPMHPKELFKDMLEKNPSLAEMLGKLDPEIL